ncbi:L-lactate dehydrogenase [Exiguobacterium flavidum]|uniref:L-lactate dehydrogenase n=1 Tax=Exiguobacterium flavidum TaxID=2184695 RepID=UPI000DF80A2B|nr:L-lactate dehydrogenase [Exiguobacterium flavidum]
MEQHAKVIRVALVGAGAVGSSFAYQMSTAGLCEELVIIDLNQAKAEGEAMDLNHGTPFSTSPMKIWAGDYSDCKDAEVVVITAGAPQKPGETRLDLVSKNAKIMKSMISSIMESGFDGIIVVASNPVDIMAHLAWKYSGLPKSRVFGSGTVLDTARLRQMLGEYFDVDSRNVHAYILGEHGDTEFAAWSNARIYGKTVEELLEDSERYTQEDLDRIYTNVRDAAYHIIERKGATYYAIGLGLVRIVRAILGNENCLLTVGAHVDGQYGIDGVHIGVPAVINRQGVREIVELSLSEEELKKFHHSADVLKKTMEPVL